MWSEQSWPLRPAAVSSQAEEIHEGWHRTRGCAPGLTEASSFPEIFWAVGVDSPREQGHTQVRTWGTMESRYCLGQAWDPKGEGCRLQLVASWGLTSTALAGTSAERDCASVTDF